MGLRELIAAGCKQRMSILILHITKQKLAQALIFFLSSLLLFGHPITTNDAGVFVLKRLQDHLLRGLELVGLELLHFAGKHTLGGHG